MFNFRNSFFSLFSRTNSHELMQGNYYDRTRLNNDSPRKQTNEHEQIAISVDDYRDRKKVIRYFFYSNNNNLLCVQFRILRRFVRMKNQIEVIHRRSVTQANRFKRISLRVPVNY